MCIYIYILYIYIYISQRVCSYSINMICISSITLAANLRTNIMDFRGFDSSTILSIRGGNPRPRGSFPESLSQAILVGILRAYLLLHNTTNNNDNNTNDVITIQ